MDYIALIIAIVFGILAGILTGVLGFVKTIIPLLKKGLKPENIDYTKLSQTIVLGAIIGAFMGYKGLPFGEAELIFFAMAENMGLTAIIDWCVKIIARSMVKSIKKKPKKRPKKKDEEE